MMTITHPIKPNSSPITAKIKSVCSSGKEVAVLTDAMVVLNSPLPFNWPEPMAMMELFCWYLASPYVVRIKPGQNPSGLVFLDKRDYTMQEQV